VRRSSQLCGVGATSRRSTRSWPRTWANVTIRLLGSDDFPLAAKREAASALTTAARDGALSIRTAEPLPLDRIAEAHDRVDAGARERVLISLPLGDSR
jgi:NADPH2:quinone reductase